MLSELLARTVVTNKLAECYTSLTHLLSETLAPGLSSQPGARNWREVDAA